MIAALILSTVISSPAQAAFVRPTDGGAAAPRILDLKPNADGKVQITVTRIVTEKQVVGQTGAIPPGNIVAEVKVRKEVPVDFTDVKELTIKTAGGKDVSVADAAKQLASGGAVIVAADGKAVDPKFLKVLRENVLVLASPELVMPGMGGIKRPPVIGRPVPLPAPLPGPQIAPDR